MTTQDTMFDVSGMSCQSCVRHVSAAVRSISGVQDVDVQLTSGKVRVRRDPTLASDAAIVAALEQAGYTARVAG